MNATEEMAYQWLMEHGANQESTVFQPHRSPDFITNIGKFEVKRTLGRTVYITKNQASLIKKEEVTFLIYVDDADRPLKLSLNELKEQFKISVGEEPIKVSPRLKKWLDNHKLIKDESYNSELLRLLKIPDKEA